MAVVQIAAVGAELIELWRQGKITDDELVARFNNNAESLKEKEKDWTERQRMKTQEQPI
jgi:hypothetical protein